MKIERINDNQFRCTVSAIELIQRHLTLKKLSTDSSKSRRLVREMIELSVGEVGFEPNELPVMVEAVRSPEGDLVFTVTKIDSPEDLPPQLRVQAEMARALQSIGNAIRSRQEWIQTVQPEPLAVFAFREKNGIQLPPRLLETPRGLQSRLYYSAAQKLYYLVLSGKEKDKDTLFQASALLREYARQMPSTTASGAYFAEHAQTVFARRAIEQIRADESRFQAK